MENTGGINVDPILDETCLTDLHLEWLSNISDDQTPPWVIQVSVLDIPSDRQGRPMLRQHPKLKKMFDVPVVVHSRDVTMSSFL